MTEQREPIIILVDGRWSRSTDLDATLRRSIEMLAAWQDSIEIPGAVVR